MSEITAYQPGTFCWSELTTSDGEGAKKFYSELFGWNIDDQPMGDGQFYSMCQIEGKNVTGLYQMYEEQKNQGVPPHWMNYVSVASVDETVEKAKSLDAQVLMDPADVFDAGRMAMLQDPTGATFGLWQPGKHIGTHLVNQPNTPCWNELATTDRDTCEKFYSSLFDWSSDTQQMELTTYTVFNNGDNMAAGALQMTEEWEGIPPHWMVYFAVDDCDQSVERAKALGAEIKVPPTDIPEIGRFSVVQDPQGAVFSVIKLSDPPA